MNFCLRFLKDLNGGSLIFLVGLCFVLLLEIVRAFGFLFKILGASSSKTSFIRCLVCELLMSFPFALC